METHLTHTQGKYAPLAEFLRQQAGPVVQMTFGEIERVIGAKLPPRASNHRAWWSNNPSNNVMTKAWREAGFKSESVDMKARKVNFRRVEAPSRRDTRGPARQTSQERHPLLGWMKGTLTIANGVDVTQPADPDWGHAADDATARDAK